MQTEGSSNLSREDQAFIYPIRRELRIGTDYSGRPTVRHCLLGEAYLSKGLPAKTSNDTEACGVLTVFVQIWNADDTNETGDEFRDSTHSELESTLTVMRVDEFHPTDSTLLGQISIDLPPDRFDMLSSEIREGSVLALSFTVMGVDYAHPVRLDTGSVHLKLVNIGIQLSDHRGEHADRLGKVVASELQRSLASEFMPDRSGILRTIAKEFAVSAAEQSLGHNERTHLAGEARHLLREIRTTFKEPLQLNSDSPDNAWSLSSGAFVEATASLDSETAKTHRWKYNRVWEHHKLNRVLQGGEAQCGPAAHGYRNNVEELEELAQLMAEYSRLSSPSLEWALVNALVYAECMAFARAIFGDAKGFAEIEAAAPVQALNTFSATLKAVRKGAIAWIGETVKIGVTFAVAFILAGQQAQTAWIITTGVTGARWIRRACLWREFQPETVRQRLLNKMASVHNLLGREDFDAGVVRHLLYQVSAEGAVFSPWVFRILDARIRRGPLNKGDR